MSSQNCEVVEQRNLVKTSAQLNFSLVIVVFQLFGDSNDKTKRSQNMLAHLLLHDPVLNA